MGRPHRKRHRADLIRSPCPLICWKPGGSCESWGVVATFTRSTRAGDVPARSTSTTTDLAAVIEEALALQAEPLPEPLPEPLDGDDDAEEDPAFDPGPLATVHLSAAAVAIIRYNNGMMAAGVRHEIRQEIGKAMAMAKEEASGQ